MKKLLNPFTYFSGGTTLVIGFVVMICMTAVAGISDQTFRGIISYGIGELSYPRLALQLLAGWAVFSALLYGAARWFSPSHIRIIDIAGNQALAKLPSLVLLVCSALYPIGNTLAEVERLQTMTVRELATFTPPIGLLLFGLTALALIVWFFAWSWRGFSIAANLRGKRAVGIYIGCYLVAEALTSWCTYMLATL